MLGSEVDAIMGVHVNAGGLGSTGDIVVVLLREHGMLWNTGGKNQVKNMCMNRVWSTHGFGECMGSVGHMV